MKNIFVIMILAFMISISSFASAATYYIATDGSNSNIGTSAQPWATFSHAFSVMSGGDTLIIRNGTYYQQIGGWGVIPSGTSSAYTTIRAESDGGVIIDGSSFTDPPLSIRGGGSYIAIEGIKFQNNKASYSGTANIAGNHIKIIKSAFVDLATPAPTGAINNIASVTVLGGSSYVLFEDCWVWGGGRYKFLIHEADRIILRRCVARHDRMDSQYPQALFSIYRSSNVLLQNSIGIDSDQNDYYYGSTGFFQGAFYSPNSDASMPNSGLKILGSIALNIGNSGAPIHSTVGTGHEIRNSVFWDSMNGAGYGYPINNPVPTISHLTIGNITGIPLGRVDDSGKGTGISGWLGGANLSITNSIIYNSASYGIYNFESSDYNDLYGNAVNYGASYGYPATPAGAHDRYVNPQLQYITRIENTSPLKGVASDGGDIGATVIKRYGVSGTLWGETGYDTLTDDNLWPFPNEERIRNDMRSYVGPPSGNRGFAASGNGLYGGPITLTSYIWEYLGNPCPAEICNYGTQQTCTQAGGACMANTCNTYQSCSSLSGSCSSGYCCSGACTLDTTPPTRSNARPTGNLSSSVTSVPINITTNEAATCRYSTTAGTSYASMTNLFSTTGSTTHVSTISGLQSGRVYNYYARCNDTAGNVNTNDFLISFGVNPVGQGNTYYISTSGSDSNPGTQAQPWRTMQHAADVVQAGSLVLVNDGTYAGFMIQTAGTSSNPITFRANGNNVIINSPNPNTNDYINIESWGSNQADYIIIDGFRITNSLRDGIRIVGGRGVIIQNSRIDNSQRFGILAGWTPSVKIINNTASNNGEHGIYVSNSNVLYDNPTVSGNIVYGNGQNGIQINGDICEGGDGLIRDALLERNTAHDNNWKGLSIISVSDSIIRNNIIYNNGISAGAGGIHIVEQGACPSQGIVYSNNNTVVSNTVIEPRIAGIRINVGNVNNVIFNNIFISNEPIALEGAGNYADATSNLQSGSTAGIFIAPGAGNYHLSNTSPVIDIGIASYQERYAPLADIEGNTRPQGFGFDSGAYEYLSGVTCTDADNDKYNVSQEGCGTADCDDSSASIRPGTTETCGNGIDENCDGSDSACETPAPTPSSSGGGGGGGSAVRTLLLGTITEGKVEKRALAAGERLRFNVGNIEHTVTLKSATQDSVELEISSKKLSFNPLVINPLVILGRFLGLTNTLTLTLGKGGSEKFDFNDDGVYELMIAFEDFSQDKATIAVTGINMPMTKQEKKFIVEIKNVKMIVCGDKICEENETSQSCCIDCGCGLSEECKESKCVVTQKATKAHVRNILVISIISLVILAVIIFIIYMKTNYEPLPETKIESGKLLVYQK